MPAPKGRPVIQRWLSSIGTMVVCHHHHHHRHHQFVVTPPGKMKLGSFDLGENKPCHLVFNLDCYTLNKDQKQNPGKLIVINTIIVKLPGIFQDFFLKPPVLGVSSHSCHFGQPVPELSVVPAFVAKICFNGFAPAQGPWNLQCSSNWSNHPSS